MRAPHQRVDTLLASENLEFSETPSHSVVVPSIFIWPTSPAILDTSFPLMAISPVYPLALAIALAVIYLALSSLKPSTCQLSMRLTCAEQRKVLIPDVYQNFELIEKDVISHNTASYDPLQLLTKLVINSSYRDHTTSWDCQLDKL
jgi:hypothetical protein